MLAIVYPPPGEAALAKEVASTLNGRIPVYGDPEWEFDHATWSAVSMRSYVMSSS